MSVVLKGAWVPLHERAKKMLEQHWSTIGDSDKLYLQSIYSRQIVWGTAFQLKRIEQLEAALNN